MEARFERLRSPVNQGSGGAIENHSHTRDKTFPAVVELLRDGDWHGDLDLSAVTMFPHEWLAELEREGFELEREGDRVRLVA